MSLNQLPQHLELVATSKHYLAILSVESSQLKKFQFLLHRHLSINIFPKKKERK